MAKSKSARRGRTAGKKKPVRKAQRARTVVKKRAKAGKKAAKASKKKAAPAKRKAPARKKTQARKKTPGRKPAAPKARGKSPVRKQTASPARPAKKTKTAARPAAARAPQRRPAREAEPIRKSPSLDRERKRLIETDENGPTAPSTLGYEGGSSAARSGRSELRESLTQHTETGPALTGGDIDANWEDAYAVGDEAPGGDNPTPDQDRVDDIGKALGVQYNDNEELKGADKLIERDRHRWELDPASSDDYQDRARDED